MRMTPKKKISDHVNEPFFTALTFTDLGYQTKIALANCLMGAWNKWGQEMFTIMAGYVSTTALAAQTAYRAIAMFVYMLPAGLRMGVMAAMSISVGERDAALAKSYYNTSLLMVLSFGIFLIIFYFAFENWLFGLFTNDPDVIAIM